MRGAANREAVIARREKDHERPTPARTRAERAPKTAGGPRWWAGLIIAGLLVRIAVSAVSFGSNDGG
jgi:hypothetical protein